MILFDSGNEYVNFTYYKGRNTGSEIVLDAAGGIFQCYAVTTNKIDLTDATNIIVHWTRRNEAQVNNIDITGLYSGEKHVSFTFWTGTSYNETAIGITDTATWGLQHVMDHYSYGYSQLSLQYLEIVYATETYTIHFNANGGSGTMPDQTATVDESTNLNLCAFTKTSYVFAGWALSASGPVEYMDGASVVNLAPADDTITLYAVWEKPTLKCILQYNKSENNKAVKELENIRQFNFKLKDPTSIIDPVLIITGDITDMLRANYMTIPIFGRSYFITNISSVRTGLVEISAHVDVLSSYIDYLKECSAIVHRQENKWNLYLDDGFFKTYQNPYIIVKKFPSGFTTQSFVLAVAGD